MQQVRREFAADATPAQHKASVSPPPHLNTVRPGIRQVAPLVPGTGPRGLALRNNTQPALVRRRGGLAVRLANLWVLHRRLAMRVLVVLMLIGGAGLTYLFREDVVQGMTVARHLMTGQVAEAGFGVAQIEITGQSLTREGDVVRALQIEDFTTTLAFDAEAARLRVEEIPSVASATIRKVYPDSIIVTIAEKTPVARWRIDGLTMLIDQAGQPIAPAGFENGDLMLVIGEGAGDDALPMIRLMERYPALTADLAALSRIADRRWDLIYYTGLRVQLPETGVVSALNQLNTYQASHQVLDRDVEIIDMRVPQYLAVRPTVRDES